MAEKKLSPRQRMINMMYLVLTALLALNVSKEVLQSFFDVNSGIVRTTTNFDSKNSRMYDAFENAVRNNGPKYQAVRDQAFEIKKEADNLHEFIQEMKYTLALSVDKKVALGDKQDLLDDEGKLNEGAGITTEWSELSDSEKKKKIGYLSNKKNRTVAGELFLSKLDPKNQKATKLKLNLLKYRDLLVARSKGNTTLIKGINDVFDIDGNDFGKKGGESWEKYNFEDMPSVGALTILSKIQSDIRNMESNTVEYLGSNLIADDLKFDGGAEAIQSSPGVVFLNDTFSAEIFLAAKNSQNPEILVGPYDSLSDGRFEMRGEYETIRVKNGKGYYSTKATAQGMQQWGGLIIMKTESGDKKYPFQGSYMVQKVEGFAAPAWMDKLYVSMSNPINVSVPGYTPDQVIVKSAPGYGSVSPKKVDKKGTWTITPKRMSNTPIEVIRIYVKTPTGEKFMGSQEFRVIDLLEPTFIIAKTSGGGVARSNLLNSKITAVPSDPDIPRKEVKYTITSFEYKPAGGNKWKENEKGRKWDDALLGTINKIKVGKSILFRNIKYTRRGLIDPKTKKLLVRETPDDFRMILTIE